MNIVITGGAGFIGSNLSKMLLVNNNKIIIIDNFNDYYDPKIKRNNVDEIRKLMEYKNIQNENLVIIEGDIRDKKILEQAIKPQTDLVIHLAAMAGVRNSILNPELYYDVNVNGTLYILEQCKKSNVTKVIFASSSSVYGNNQKVPFNVNDFVDNPISPYAATKKSGELLCHTYHHLYDMSLICLRFFTVYGPGQRPDLAIHKFTKLIMEDKYIPFYGDGTTSRDYTYIDDIVSGICNCIEYINRNQPIYKVFNLGGDKTISLKQMVKTIEKTLNKKAKLNILPMQPGDVNTTCADIKISREELNYEPKISFEAGIEKFIEWLRCSND